RRMAAAAVRGRRFKWSLELAAAPGGRPRGAAEGRGPLGFAERQLGEGGVHESDKILMEKRCWDVALAPLKQIPMNLFIMYMAGNTISIFPAMMVCMMGWRPLQALMSLSASEYNPTLQPRVTAPWVIPRGHPLPRDGSPKYLWWFPGPISSGNIHPHVSPSSGPCNRPHRMRSPPTVAPMSVAPMCPPTVVPVTVTPSHP
uniref:ER membrane protein complex subunit 4 n=1 Tax=Falco tinnunculus TaxID=100819 RepID=A0A8C4V0E1_FALTI